MTIQTFSDYYNIKDSSSYHIAVRVLEDSSTLAIFNPPKADIIAFAEIEGLPQNILNHKLFEEKYAKTIVELSSNNYQLIPKEFIENEGKLPLPKSDEIVDLKITVDNDLFMGTELSKPMNAFYKKVKDKATISHTGSTAIQKMLAKDYPTPRVLVQYFQNFINIVISQEGKLLFSNSFAIGSDEEALYYIVSIYEKWNFSQKNVAVLVDEVVEAKNFEKELSKYIGIVTSMELPKNKSYSLDLKKVSSPRKFAGVCSLF